MTDDKKPTPPPVEDRNPRYKSATPEMALHALLQPKPKRDDDGKKDADVSP